MDSASDAKEQERLRRRARFGMMALAVRSVLQNLIMLGANLYLARALSPADYGIVSILQFAMSILRLVSDAGLGAALVQRLDAPDQRLLSTIFWLQLGFCLGLLGLAWVGSPYLMLVWPELPPSAPWLLRGLSLALLFTMLRTIPLLMLERNVRFGLVGSVEFLGTVGFYGTAIVLASRGAGALALIAASVAQALFMTVAVNAVERWRPALVFDWQRARPLLKFGLAFQGTNAVNFINGAVTPLLVGSGLGQTALGLIEFARNTAWFPTNVVGIVRRVSFPHLSRLQQDRAAFSREFERAVLLCAVPIFFFLGLFFGVAPSIVTVGYSDKWLPAVPALYVYSLGISINFYAWIGSAALEALGATSRLFRLVVVTSVLNCVATSVALAISPTLFAFALGYVVHLLVSAVIIYASLRTLLPEARPLARLGALVFASAVLAGAGRMVRPWTETVPGLLAWLVAAIALFGAAALLVDPELRAIARQELAQRRAKRAAAASARRIARREGVG
jgi:O-antigen/teichoic acid export membrane protein